MIMKVFNKGQVVIPAAIRKALGISVGDMLDVRIDEKRQAVELRRVEPRQSEKLAGSLAAFAKKAKPPTRRQMTNALRKGLMGE